MDKRYTFEHDSLQDRKSIRKYLKAIMEGVGKGTLSLADENGEVSLNPDGLMHLSVQVQSERDRRRLSITIDWRETDPNSADNTGALIISPD
jgi:amphi-Trp domain-containing protein